MSACSLKNRTSERTVRSSVGSQSCLHSLQNAIFITAYFTVYFHGMTLRMIVYAFLPAEIYLYGTLSQICAESCLMLYAHILLAPEASAHNGTLNPYILLRYAEILRQLMVFIINTLSSRNYYNTAVTIRHCHRCFRLQKCMLCRRKLECSFHNILRILKSFFHISSFNFLMREKIVLRNHHLSELHKAFAVNLMGSRASRLLCGNYGFQYLIINIYCLDCRFSLLSCFRHHHCYCIAYTFCLLAHINHARPVVSKMSYISLAGYVLGGKHCHNSRHSLCFLYINRQYPCTGILAEYIFTIQHSFKVIIVCIFCLS